MNTIVLTETQPVWLFALLFLSGVLLQLAYFFRRHRGLLFTGICLVLAAAGLDCDITLAVGQVLVAFGIVALRNTNKL